MSSVVGVQPGVQTREYFLYPKCDAEGRAWRPKSSGALGDIARDLHEAMAAETGKP